MKKLISNLGDHYGLYDLHKDYSVIDQFFYNEEEVIKFNSSDSKVYFEPKLPKIEFKNEIEENDYIHGKLKFLSQIENEECNKEAIFYYDLFKDIHNENTNVIMIHGWRTSKLDKLENLFLKDFMKEKYNIYRYILPYHLDRCPKTAFNGEYFFSANVNKTIKSVQQSVNDIRALIKFIRNNNKGKIILIGLSLGGFVTNLVSEFEKEIDLLISLFYANDLSFVTFKSIPGKFIRQDFEKHKFSNDLLSKAWRVINPSTRKPLISLDRIFLASGMYDKYVLEKDSKILWESWGKPKRQLFKCGHSGIVLYKNEIRKETIEFIKERV
ncbi:alpha/beta hydrolase family protein [Clostridium sp. SHJSY1]|uniref:alpha/beta hydrolase n=1 Tax=Clostridium sp. SHJSY1 TaxID=2942483 RepID=UPI002876983B|nr:alpha/beta hydrolase [Clostridium sp. SHJSY1]MDS0526331.1 alpha/beta hydrolase family protein [Clostridium sp. SHJSY1]